MLVANVLEPAVGRTTNPIQETAQLRVRLVAAVRKIPPILVAMPEKVVNTSSAPTPRLNSATWYMPVSE